MSRTIPCSVGILTFNSEKTLARTLESVKDFNQIIISDGGSTDDTLAIATSYGCTIIEQYAKNHPGETSFHPIDDFARERNQLLAAATEPWFFYIDSDEYISPTLHDEISVISNQATPLHYAYEVPIAVQSPDATVTYQQWKQTYQIRFFHCATNGMFQKPMHERYVFDRVQYPVGRLKGHWYVPLSKPDFASYKRTVDHRLVRMLATHPPKSFGAYMRYGVLQALRGLLGLLYRAVMIRIIYPGRPTLPLSYLRNQLYSLYATLRIQTKLYLETFK